MRSINIDCQRSVNLYFEPDESHEAKEGSVGALIGTPGLSSPLLTLGASPIRGQFVASNGALYVCAGNKLYTISTSWVATSVGTINTSGGPVSMADNGIDLVLVDGSNGWYTALGSSSLTQITDPNYLGNATQVRYQDGVFIFNIPGTNQFFVSDQLAVTFSGYFDSKATSPDSLIGTLSDHRNLWLFGSSTTEVWFDAGNPPPSTPFSLIQGGYVEAGCAAWATIKKLDNTVFMLGRDPRGAGIVYAITGFQFQRISTFAVEYAISTYGDISGSTAWTYQDGGHQFYCINFKNASNQSVANTTWCYDLMTGLWHERVSTSNGAFNRHIVECHSFFNNVHVVGDYSSGNLYQLASTIYSDNGNPRTCQRIFPHTSSNLDRVYHSQFQIDFEAGVGLDGSGQGTDPMAMLQWSNDSGHTWSNEHWTSIGEIGETKQRAVWRRLGQARDRVYKVTVTDPVKVIMINAQLNAQEGTS